jgi:hypothetical protein
MLDSRAMNCKHLMFTAGTGWLTSGRTALIVSTSYVDVRASLHTNTVHPSIRAYVLTVLNELTATQAHYARLCNT